MKKAILFPYSKETKHFMDFKDLGSIEIISYISPSIIGGKLPLITDYKVFKSFDDAVIPPDIQLLIVGYTQRLNELRKTDYLEKALTFALEHNLDLYAFDDIYKEKYNKYLEASKVKKLNFYSPQITKTIFENKKKNSNVTNDKNVPSIMILGSSPSQGKFTLMMTLKRIFGEQAFYIGTEHHSMLFNIDITFPYGVQAGVQIPMYEYKKYLELSLNNIDNSKKLVISCAQSGLIPPTLNDGINRSYTLATIAFFLGINPKYVIFVFNPYYDELNFIKRTIDFINTTSNSQILCLAFSDKRKDRQEKDEYFTNEEIQEIKTFYSRNFNLPCFSIKHDDWSILNTYI